MKRLGVPHPPSGQVPAAGECESRHHTGYRGRIVVMEYLPVTTELGDLIADRAKPCHALKAGYTPLHVQGLHKVAHGLTTLDEVSCNMELPSFHRPK
ncbi:MAG: hypothetical protein EA425_14275 [Puniceicoccaceae bacterium]|nr:MAG: hypothetical protein EA425_14275 [Puniceicoccaceae bacterium]